MSVLKNTLLAVVVVVVLLLVTLLPAGAGFSPLHTAEASAPAGAAVQNYPIALTGTITGTLDTIDQDYSLAVQGADQNYIPGDSPARATVGQKWILVFAGLYNFTGTPISVTQESLALIDQDGSRHLPELPDARTQPSLVGATLGAGQRELGFALFEVTPDITGEWLEWCPTAPITDCVNPLQSPVPLTPTGS